MPYLLHISPPLRVSYVQFSGFVDGCAMLQAACETLEHPQWQPGFHELWDLRAATTVDLSLADFYHIQRFERMYSNRLGNGSGVVLSQRDIFLSLIRLLQLLLPDSKRTFLVVQTEEEACKRLGLPVFPSVSSLRQG